MVRPSPRRQQSHPRRCAAHTKYVVRVIFRAIQAACCNVCVLHCARKPSYGPINRGLAWYLKLATRPNRWQTSVVRSFLCASKRSTISQSAPYAKNRWLVCRRFLAGLPLPGYIVQTCNMHCQAFESIVIVTKTKTFYMASLHGQHYSFGTNMKRSKN